MLQNGHKLYDGPDEYLVELVFSDYEGPLNQIYRMTFHCLPNGSSKPKAFTITISDRTIEMWTSVGGNKDILEDKEIFAWQILKAYIYKIKDTESVNVFIYTENKAPIRPGFIGIKAAPTISETARNIIFSDQKPTNALIRREILKICFDSWQKAPHTYLNRSDLLKFIPVSDIELERNLDYLKNNNFIDAHLTSGGYATARITSHGIDTFEDPVGFETRFPMKAEQQTIKFGDIILTQIIGDNNQNIIKSKVEKASDEKTEEDN